MRFRARIHVPSMLPCGINSRLDLLPRRVHRRFRIRLVLRLGVIEVRLRGGFGVIDVWLGGIDVGLDLSLRDADIVRGCVEDGGGGVLDGADDAGGVSFGVLVRGLLGVPEGFGPVVQNTLGESKGLASDSS